MGCPMGRPAPCLPLLRATPLKSQTRRLASILPVRPQMHLRYGITVVLAGLTLTLGCDVEPLEFEDADAEASEPLTFRALEVGTDYTIINQQTGWCADVPFGLPSATVINHYPCHEGPEQRFRFHPNTADATLSMINRSSDKCVAPMALGGGGYGAGQFDCFLSDPIHKVVVENQVNHTDGVTATIRSTDVPNLCLQAPSTLTAIQLPFEPCDGGTDQRWRLRIALTCEDSCGGKAEGACWCDEQCQNYGDCCPDYEDLCGSGDNPPCPVGQTCCEPDAAGGCSLCVPSGQECP